MPVDILIVEDEAVLAMAEESRPKLILLDIKLRGDIDGIEVAKIIRRSHAVPIVSITAYSDPETLRRAWLTGPACILGKTGGGLELGRVVAKLMESTDAVF